MNTTIQRNLRCACEATAQLIATELEPALPAQRCPSCEGSLMELEDYRRWVAHGPADGVSTPLAVVHDDAGVRRCPTCDRLMQRLRVGAQPEFRVDRCAPCQAVWFDAGEWPALRAAGQGAQLEAILSDGGQRQLQAEELRRLREDALRRKHGDACIDELARVRQWLSRQSQPDELLALLRTGW